MPNIVISSKDVISAFSLNLKAYFLDSIHPVPFKIASCLYKLFLVFDLAFLLEASVLTLKLSPYITFISLFLNLLIKGRFESNLFFKSLSRMVATIAFPFWFLVLSLSAFKLICVCHDAKISKSSGRVAQSLHF